MDTITIKYIFKKAFYHFIQVLFFIVRDVTLFFVGSAVDIYKLTCVYLR